MDKKYALKVKEPPEPDSIEAADASTQDEKTASPKQGKSKGGVVSFLKFAIIWVLVSLALIAIWRHYKNRDPYYTIRTKISETIYDELLTQAMSTTMYKDLAYYEEFDLYEITLQLDGAQDFLAAAKSGMYQEKQLWNDFVSAMVVFNTDALDCIIKYGSEADCCVVLYDENNRLILELQNGIVMNDVISDN